MSVSDTSELLTALSNYAWPLVAIIVLVIYKKEIEKLVKRISKIKAGDKEIDFENSTDKLGKEVKEVQRKIPEKIDKQDVQDEEKIIEKYASNPELGIILLSQEIQAEIKEIYASLGLLSRENYTTPIQALHVLVDTRRLPDHVLSSFEIFESLKNRLIHGESDIDEKEIIRVLDIGLTFLRILKSIPHEINIVYKSDVDLYSDSECKDLIMDAKGLMLKTKSAGGLEKTFRIFPTTKTGYYKRSKIVAWEWNFEKIWGETWYVDPKTKRKSLAWNSSAEFIGRHLEEIK